MPQTGSRPPGDEGGAHTGSGAGDSERTAARVPTGAAPPFRVFVNGVEQEEGSDYTVEGDRLVFTRPLVTEGRLGFWRWAAMVLGIAGTYRKHETVDLHYDAGGRPRVATGLPLEPDATAPGPG